MIRFVFQLQEKHISSKHSGSVLLLFSNKVRWFVSKNLSNEVLQGRAYSTISDGTLSQTCRPSVDTVVVFCKELSWFCSELPEKDFSVVCGL